ncbi:MAG TPA: DUF5924 family protein [Thermoanaerobaculia bacterium]|nr:DUF5924 family protein [Thermoanaerobaculia bacterium]
MRERWEERLGGLARFAARHQGVFWTLHSLWALGWGAVFVLVGKDRPALLRWGLVSIGAVWLTSLALPAVLAGSRIPQERKGAARKLVLWGQKWLLQGLAFFLLPLYHRSATYSSSQAVFMALLAAAALAATIDVVYDEVVTRKRPLLGGFLAFVAFATVNVTLPMVWRVGGLWNLVASGVLATAVFVSFIAGRGNGRSVRAALRTALVALFFLALVTLGRPAVPPAPLRLASVRFGTSLAENGRDVASPLAALPAGVSVRLVAVAAVQAPADLQEGVRHVWSVDGREISESRIIEITGGRGRGFRSRSSVSLPALRPGQRVRLEVETARGQIIGRAELRAQAPPTP